MRVFSKRKAVTPGLHGEAAAGTCDQHTNTTGPLYLLPVYSAVLYSTHCTVPRRDVWPVSALCQAALLWLPLSLAHGRIIISSCNHNLVFFNLYDECRRYTSNTIFRPIYYCPLHIGKIWSEDLSKFFVCVKSSSHLAVGEFHPLFLTELCTNATRY